MKASEVAARIRAEKSRTFGLERTEALQILDEMPFDFDLSGDLDEIKRLTAYEPHPFLACYAMTLICCTIRRAER